MIDTETTNLQYIKYYPLWRKCRDAYAGQEKVHEQGELYLPKLSSLEEKELYQSRLMRATFFGATQRTVDALVGTMFKNNMVENIPDYLKEWSKNVTASAKVALVDYKQFAQEVAREAILVGHNGVLVDFPNVDTQSMTEAEFTASGLSVYLKMYKAEDILDWYEDEVGGIRKLIFVKLREKYNDFNYETLTSQERTRYRCLVLEDNQYKQIIIDEDNNQSVIIPRGANGVLDYIPFVFFNPNGNGSDVEKPMLIDMVNINFDHYRTTADYKHGMHYSGLPTPYVTGVTPEKLSETNNGSLAIGPRSFIILPEAESKCGYLQVAPEVFKDYREELKVLEDRMAVLGARALITERKQTETADAIELKSAGEQSVLSKIADSIASGLTSVLRIVDDWYPGENTKDIYLGFSKDFGLNGISPLELAEIFKGVQAGIIPTVVYFENLKRAGYIDEDMDFEEYSELVESDEIDSLAELAQEAKEKELRIRNTEDKKDSKNNNEDNNSLQKD